MKLYIVKTPNIIQRLYSDYLWRFSSVPKDIYLTFDDGPTEDITSFVLSELKKYNAKATFFCIGKNVTNHPDIYQEILKAGHSVGNHTNNHLNGFKTTNTVYQENIKLAAEQIDSKLFRPPYGKLKRSQAKQLILLGYKVVMWDVLSADFDKKVSSQKCLENVLKNTTNGSIVVMHDSKKCKEKIKFTLPKVLAHFSKKGYQFKAII